MGIEDDRLEIEAAINLVDRRIIDYANNIVTNPENYIPGTFERMKSDKIVLEQMERILWYQEVDDA